MKVLTVFSHPRRQSLSGAVLDAFTDGLRGAEQEVEIADLHAESFDPVMTVADEPDWNDSRKRYSDAVLREQARIARNDALAFVFPVWWWSLPAMLKGWIDRVWNNGWAYGDRKLSHRRAVLLAWPWMRRSSMASCIIAASPMRACICFMTHWMTTRRALRSLRAPESWERPLATSRRRSLALGWCLFHLGPHE
jgi:putative NADPH-quinone reductase